MTISVLKTLVHKVKPPLPTVVNLLVGEDDIRIEQYYVLLCCEKIGRVRRKRLDGCCLSVVRESL